MRLMAAFDYAERITRARDRVAAEGYDALLLSVGCDLPYLTGYEAPPLERLTMLVVTAADAVLVVPELEGPRVPPGPFDVRPWGELESPIDIVADLVGGSQSVAIGDHTWSVFLLRLQDALGSACFSSAAGVIGPLRAIKEQAEIERLRAAAHAADRVAASLAKTQMSGHSERQIARLVGEWVVEEGHDVAGFAIVASGPNGASPHHEPTDRVLGQGDMVVVDFGGRLGGYTSDTTRMFVIGEPTTEQGEVHDIVRVAQQEAVDAVAPGVPAAEIDRAARRIIDDAGYGDHFIHRTGHGIGLEVHEEPYIIETNPEPLMEGMAFSIEPGIYLPGRFGVRIEDIVTVTATGVEPLNRSEHGLISVD